MTDAAGEHNNKRTKLEEFRKSHGFTSMKEESAKRDPPDTGEWVMCFSVTGPSPENRVIRENGRGSTKSEAKEDAARIILATMEREYGRQVDAKEIYRQAIVGDAILDLLLALRGHREGLTKGEMDDARQAGLSNLSLSNGQGGKRISTEEEARVGRSALENSGTLERLTRLLEEAAGKDNVARVEAAVRKLKKSAS